MTKQTYSVDGAMEPTEKDWADFGAWAERDRKDAERYRFLRANLYGCDFDWNESGETVVIFGWPRNVPISADCDATIDAALSASKEQKK